MPRQQQQAQVSAVPSCSPSTFLLFLLSVHFPHLCHFVFSFPFRVGNATPTASWLPYPPPISFFHFFLFFRRGGNFRTSTSGYAALKIELAVTKRRADGGCRAPACVEMGWHLYARPGLFSFLFISLLS
ncbi:hypothetical protein K438DRAFT_694125 [Mycena galopus ATCC 62051]|nr:hypothetical protein K438DRAFT_694125 [Mycena galopus ATCC 62051]